MKRRFLAPEVIQTSAMDCGPAALKCLLDGFGIPVSYGRLREACQTEVDGTSIDTIEEVAVRLGLEASQVIVPPDHLLLPEAELLPALAVLVLPSGFTHFVIVWRRVGRWVQIMDPGQGRIWMEVDRLLDQLFIHEMAVPAESWREWIESGEAQATLHRQLRDLDIEGRAGELSRAALADSSWRSIATIDAARRAVSALVKTGAVRRGREAFDLFATLATTEGAVPEAYFSVKDAPPGEDGEPRVLLRGAVLIAVRGLREVSADEEETLPPELSAAIFEKPVRPTRELFRMILADGVLSPWMLAFAMVLATMGVIIEALAFRSLLDLGGRLGLPDQRVAAVLALLVLIAALALLETSIASAVARHARGLETRLRAALFEKLARLGDRYFRSRPTADMAERSHSLHLVRAVPSMAERFVQGVMGLVATVLAIAWLDLESGLVALACAAAAVVVPWSCQPILAERDLRARSHQGALARYYLDSLLGLVSVRAHSAEKAIVREHESLLVDWVRASQAMLRAVVSVSGAQAMFGFAMATLVVLSFASGTNDAGSLLLAAYWALLLPVYGEEVAELFWRYPAQRNVVLRHLELITAMEAPDEQEPNDAVDRPREGGVAIDLEHATVHAGGHPILEEIDLVIEAGQHVAIVGASGAGKSSLLGLLLGWHRASQGRVLIDGEPLRSSRLEALRAVTAWIDPEVQIWNRTLLENLIYGAEAELDRLGSVLEKADLFPLLESLPDGLSTALGEGGGLVSGGEGQRVRVGRALLRSNVRLALLDEPFRGLDRDKRALLLQRAREHYRNATLLCVTHDVAHTIAFDRVLVVDGGRIVEDGIPAELQRTESSHYRRLLEAEEIVKSSLWQSAEWRACEMAKGRLFEGRGGSK